MQKFDTRKLEGQAAEVAAILRAIANERRLMILCKLVEWGEANVNSLADAVGLSQSALSQHLAKMRDEGVVAYRRESQTLWYRRRSQNRKAVHRAPWAVFLRARKKAPDSPQRRTPLKRKNQMSLQENLTNSSQKNAR